MIKVQFENESERNALIEQKSEEGFLLIEEQYLNPGNYLLFSDNESERKVYYTHVPITTLSNLQSKTEELEATLDSVLTELIPSLLG